LIKTLFVAAALLFAQPTFAQEPCVNPVKVLELVKGIDSSPSVLKYSGKEASEINSVLEEFLKGKNPYPFDMVEIFLVNPPGRPGGVIFVFYNNSCGSSQAMISADSMLEVMVLLKNRGVSFL